MAVTTATRLGCGRDVDDVWAGIERSPDPHEQGCPYCTQARADLAGLFTATHELIVSDEQDTSLRVPEPMLASVLAIVRTEVRRGRTIPLQRSLPAQHQRSADPRYGATDDATTLAGRERVDMVEPVPSLTVSEQVIATVVRDTCDRNPDVEVRRVSIEVDDGAATAPAVSGAPTHENGAVSTDLEDEPSVVTITLQATVRRGVAIPALFDQLRAQVRLAVSAAIGVTVSRIDVEVHDVFDA